MDDDISPWWAERQRALGAELDVNTSERRWSTLGTIGDCHRALIDPRGAITPASGGWLVDWWVGFDDQWYVPSRTASVRQSLDGDAPVVETVLRVPSGEVVHRAWAVADGDGDVPAVVIEVHNTTSAAIAVAFAVLPWDLTGTASITDIGLDGTTVLVDGAAALSLPRSPSRFATGDISRSAFAVTAAGDASEAWLGAGARCAEGRASAAFILPLPHTASVRAVVPLGGSPIPPERITRFADAERVVSGWRAQTDGAARFAIPEHGVDAAIVAAQRFARVQAGADVVLDSFGDEVDGLASCELANALAQHGEIDAAVRILLSMADRQLDDGAFDHDRVDATAAWLVMLDRLVDLADDDSIALPVVDQVTAAALAIRHRERRGRLRSRGRPFGRGAGPSWLVDDEQRMAYDIAWATSAYAAAASLLARAGQDEGAGDVAGFATELAPLVTSVPLPGALVDGFVAVDDARTIAAPSLTADVAGVAAQFGSTDAIDALRWLCRTGPNGAWPDRVDPRTGAGVGSDGHDVRSTAAFLQFVRSLAVVERTEALDLLPVVPTEWYGQGLEVHDAPTTFGRLSFAIRWHGERPALLWDLEAPRSGAPAVSLRVPGLDPSWSTTDLRGETLLGTPPGRS